MVVKRKFELPTYRELYRTTFGRDKWATKTPIEKWSYIFGGGRKCGSITGLRIFNDEPSFKYRVIPLYCYIITYAAMFIYTVAFHLKQGDPQNSFPCTCLFIGPICSVSSEYP